MQNQFIERTIALAAIFQAAALVKQLAWTGRGDETGIRTSIHSLLRLESESVIDVFGKVSGLQTGFNEIVKLFENPTSKKTQKDAEIARYTLSLVHLERKLMKHTDMITTIKHGIARAKNQAEVFELCHENVMANLASLYTDTLSQFKFRIHVTGKPYYLNTPHNANQVRAILLAGIRASVLWRQLGGNRMQLLFNRKQYLQAAKHLLELYCQQSQEVIS